VPAGASDDFNRFDAALCDVAAAAALDDFLDDLRAAAPGVFAFFVFARAADFDLDFRLAVSPAFRAGEVLEDFLRDSWTYAFLSSLSADQPWEYCGSRSASRK